MKDILKSLFDSLKSSNTPTRIVIAMAMVLAMAAAGVATYRSANPHMVPVYTGLDDTQFGAVTSALSNARVRFETSSPPGPFSVFVAEREKYDALSAIHAAGAMASGGKGIPSGASSSTIFMGHGERMQLTRKRDWEDLEKQLESLSFVLAAKVRTSVVASSTLRKQEPPTVSVIVTLRGSLSLAPEQRQTLAAIVRNSTNVPDDNITIADHLGNTLFDGARDQTLDSILAFEKSFTDTQTARAQGFLDRTFGPGMAIVSVTGDWDHDRTEEVDEAHDPTKLKVSETTSESRTPIESGFVGGPAGTASNIDAGSPARVPEAPVAEQIDSEVSYAYSTKTTHRVQQAPELQRLSVTLLIDSSIADRLTQAESFVKQLVGFQETRDVLTASAVALATIERDADGNPVVPEVEAPLEPPSATMTMLFEHGVEILAAGAFLFVLLRSLKKGAGAARESSAAGAQGATDGILDEEVDVELLARRQVEQMIEQEPERVGALLSRWALGEKSFAGADK